MAKLHRKTASKPTPTAYQILGVSPGDDLATIHRVYKDLAVTGHPDHGGDGEIFARITMAWSVLKNTRAVYDAQLRLQGRLNCKTCGGTGLRKTYQSRKLVAVKCEICRGFGEDRDAGQRHSN